MENQPLTLNKLIPQKQSQLGVISFVIGILLLVGFVFFILVPTPIPHSGLYIIRGFEVIGLVLGVIVLFQRNTKKLYALLGAILCGLPLAVTWLLPLLNLAPGR